MPTIARQSLNQLSLWKRRAADIFSKFHIQGNQVLVSALTAASLCVGLFVVLNSLHAVFFAYREIPYWDQWRTVSELKQVAGIEVVGPIPYGLQTPAVFSAGRMAATNKPVEADRLLRFLASPEVAPALRESGLEP